MLSVNRNPLNPILAPNPANPWESVSVFNGCITKQNSLYTLLYRALSSPQNYQGINLQLSTIGKTTSPDRTHFTNRSQLIKPECDWEKFGCEDPRVVFLDNKYYIFYTALSNFPPSAPSIKVGLAISPDLEVISEKHLVTPFNAKAMSLFPEKIAGKYVAILTANTDLPPAQIAIAMFDTEDQIWSADFWRNWYPTVDSFTLPLRWSTADQVEVGAPPVKTPYGWLLVYSYIKNYFTSNPQFTIRAVLLDINNPLKIIGRIDDPLLIPKRDYELSGTVSNVVFPSGAMIENDHLFIYYGAADSSCNVASTPIKEVYAHMVTSNPIPLKFTRLDSQPILSPVSEHPWESKAVFNPGAIRLNDKTHLLYRAMSNDDTSVLGYASTEDGIHISERLPEPAYFPREDFESKKNPGNSGCEDPRLTFIDNSIYICYTAFDGVNPPRVALSSIASDDFLAHRWDKWQKPALISAPGIDDKDACIFPEKINGNYVIFHRIQPGISIDSRPNLVFSGQEWLKSESYILPRPALWDSAKIGIAGPPVKTSHGWLLIYHGISSLDHQYRLGALLLDLNNPKHIIARTEHPLFEPELDWEKNGIYSNVVFPCNTIINQDQLYIYYGGADKVTGVAAINFSGLIDYLLNQVNPQYLTSEEGRKTTPAPYPEPLTQQPSDLTQV
jgi:beta-1,2-mannobiose phosphorylase / 1,2-beta-oligomannan phosphorylase